MPTKPKICIFFSIRIANYNHPMQILVNFEIEGKAPVTCTQSRFPTAELRMLTMPPRFDRTLVRFKPVASRPPTNLDDLVVVMRQSQGGGGTLIFSSYVGSGPETTLHPPPPPPQKKAGISRTLKNI